MKWARFDRSDFVDTLDSGRSSPRTIGAGSDLEGVGWLCDKAGWKPTPTDVRLVIDSGHPASSS